MVDAKGGLGVLGGLLSVFPPLLKKESARNTCVISRLRFEWGFPEWQQFDMLEVAP